jgi:hypothetical protein
MRKGLVKAASPEKNEEVGYPETGLKTRGDSPCGVAGLNGRPAKNAEANRLSVERVPNRRRDSYAERVIDDPGRFDAVEVHDVCEFSDPEGPSCEEPGCDRVTPSTFSVYAHLKDGGIDCCGDFAQSSDALAYGAELASIHHWPLFNYISFKCQNSSEAQCRDALLTMAVSLRAGCIQALDPLDRSFEDDRSAISAIRSVYEAGITEIRRQLKANKDQVRSRTGTANGK